jgi:hypothetical protein
VTPVAFLNFLRWHQVWTSTTIGAETSARASSQARELTPWGLECFFSPMVDRSTIPKFNGVLRDGEKSFVFCGSLFTWDESQLMILWDEKMLKPGFGQVFDCKVMMLLVNMANDTRSTQSYYTICTDPKMAK